MSKLQIIGTSLSNFVRTARMAAQEKGVPYDLVEVMPRSDQATEIHPGGMIPVMKHGERTLFESRAITRYIDEAFDGPPLMPRDPWAAAQAEQWLAYVATSVDKAVIRELVHAYFFSRKPDKSPDREIVDRAAKRVARQFATLGKAVERTGYLSGDNFGLADMYAMPIISQSRVTPEGKEAMASAPSLLAYYEKHKVRPSFADTAPPRGK
ncbi:MAG: glutathione S-transferase family protein [Xanthobacteraceae bacterium]|nr:glutathione S-transferase family protein [Xanthobacteraceae bacterium]MCW5675480.1 glutathione S-transferase family protein [Xanthobacteraceae bacterium]